MAERKIEFASRPVEMSVETWIFCESQATKTIKYPDSPRKYEIENRGRFATVLEAVMHIRKEPEKLVSGQRIIPSFSICEWADGRHHMIPEASIRIRKDGIAEIDELLRSTRADPAYTAELQQFEKDYFLNPEERPQKNTKIAVSDTWGRFFSTLLDALCYLRKMPGRAIAIKMLESDLAHPELIIQNLQGNQKVVWLI